MVWKPGPSAGSRTAPAMQPDAWLPMMSNGPDAGVSRAAIKPIAAARSAPSRRAGRRGSEPPLEDRDDIARLNEGFPACPAFNRLAPRGSHHCSIVLDRAVGEPARYRDRGQYGHPWLI